MTKPKKTEVAALKKKIRELKGRLSLMHYVFIGDDHFMFERARQKYIGERATNLRCRDWKMEV